MASHTAVADMYSAPVPATAAPGVYNADHSAKHDKDVVFGAPEVSAAADVEDDEEEPTDEDFVTLRKVPAPMKWSAIAMCAIELAERASYYGCKDVFGNFVRGPLPAGGNGAGAVAPGAAGLNQSAGALGKGSVVASASTSTFTFLSYLIPILGGIIADTKWGRFKTIAVGTAIGFFAHILLVVPAIPAVIATGNGYIPFIISIIILAFAAGFIKPCLGPLLCDQSPVKKPVIRRDKNGQRYILDPQATVQRYLLIFYWCINVGGFFSLATTYSERFVGFWLAFLEPGIIYCLVPLVLVFAHKRLYLAPPQGSVVLEALSVIKMMFKRAGLKALKGGDDAWNSVKPSVIQEREGSIDTAKVYWDDTFVDEVRAAISACTVSFLIPVFNLADGGIGNQVNDLSASMTLSGVPNDVINNFNPLTIIVFTPIITFGLYPYFEKIGHPIKPMTRMCIGYILGTITMIFGAVLQWKVYQTSPCGYYATDCEDGVSPVSLWWLITLYGIPALGEIFINVTSYELAYTRAPARMKSLVYAIILFNQAISAAIGLALSKVIADPNLIWPYVALAAGCAICAVLCPTVFRHLNDPVRTFADPKRQAGLYQPNGGQANLNNQSTQQYENVDEKI